MGDWWFLVHIAVFVAALVQAATGLGFGLVAGPALMLALGDVSAIQISILLSLMIALVLSPPLFKHSSFHKVTFNTFGKKIALALTAQL